MGVGRPPHDLGDRVEGHAEHVVQDERHPLGRRQGFQHDVQGDPHVVGDHRLALGVPGTGTTGAREDDDGVRDVGVEERLGAQRARPQHVQGDPGHDGGQPAAEVLDVAGVGAVEAKPRLLHRVLGFAQ